MSHVAHVEAFFLKPLSILFLLVAVFFLFKTSWLVGGWMALGWFVIGSAGASLHPNLTARQLAQGTLNALASEIPVRELPHDDSFRMAKAFFKVTVVTALSGLIVSRHYDFGWWAAIGVAVAAWGGSMMLAVVATLAASFIANRS
jgi:hypothetical protein